MAEPIVGRDAALAAIDEFVALTDGVHALVLEGEPGIGKTTLWHEGVRRAEARGYAVLSCRPALAEAKLSYGALGDLLSGAPHSAFASLPPPQRNALDAVLLRADAAPRGPERRAVSVATLSLLSALAAASPVLLAVDDAQWLDAATASVLTFVARRLRVEPLKILTAVRVTREPVSTFADGVAETRRRVLRVAALTIGSLHQVIKQRLGRVFPRPTLVRIEQISRGNPFYALEVARALLATSDPSQAAVNLPADRRRLLVARVRRLPPKTRDALLVLSAVSTPTGDLVDERALAPAVEAGIVEQDESGRIEFTHPLLASAVYSSAPATVRRELHRRLAELVPDLEERAGHLALATTAPDQAVAEALEEGAARARSRGAWESAADLLTSARTLTPPDRTDDAQRRGVLAAEHWIYAGDRPRAKGLLLELLVELPAGPSRGEALRLLAEICHHEESFPEAARLFGEALEHIDDPRRAAVARLGLSYVHVNMIDYGSAAAEAQLALAQAEAAGDGGLVAQSLAFREMMNFVSGRGADWASVERALRLEDPSALVPLNRRPSTVAALIALYSGKLAPAGERLHALRARARELGDESELAFILFWLVWLDTVRGDFAAASECAEEAVVLAELTGSESDLAWVLGMRANLRAHRGEIEQARADAEEAAAIARRSGWATSARWITAAQTFIEVSVGDAAAALCAAESLVQPEELHGIGEPAGDPFLPDALEAMILLGQLDRAEALIGSFVRRGEELDREWAVATGGRCRGLLLAARGDLAGAEAALEQALERHARIDMPFEEARTRLCLGRVQRRTRKRSAARETLTRALDTFERLGAPLWAEQARAELDRTGVRRAPEQLTAGEEAVAELAAAGLTNREIAAKLFVSRRTVEANLARVYAKLGIHSRAELGAWLAHHAT